MAGGLGAPLADKEPQLTDLPMIKVGRAERLKAAGVDSIEKLWKADLGKLADHPAFETDDGFLNQLALLQGFAEAHCKKAALVYAEDPRLWDMDQPVLHMDLEFDGPAAEIFLYGILDHDSDDVQSWFDHTRKGQEELLHDFRKICIDQRPTVVTWGGRSSDTVQLKRSCEKYGMPTKWLQEVAWFDLQSDLVFTGNPETQRIYLPVRKFKSETVAQFFGYQKPKLRVKDGYHALKLYRTYKRRQDPQIKKDLCDYNAEDVRHLKLILDGIRELMRPHL